MWNSGYTRCGHGAARSGLQVNTRIKDHLESVPKDKIFAGDAIDKAFLAAKLAIEVLKAHDCNKTPVVVDLGVKLALVEDKIKLKRRRGLYKEKQRTCCAKKSRATLECLKYIHFNLLFYK